MFKRLCISMCLFGLVLGFVACATPTPVPTATDLPSPKARAIDTAMPAPTETITHQPTLTPTTTPTTAPTQTPSPTATPVATIAARIFPSDKLNEWKPEYSNTGTQLDLLELRRTQETGKSTAITYQLATTGLDKGQSYELWSFSIWIGKPQLAGKVDLDADGNVGIGALTIASFSKGEPLRLALASADRKTVVFGKVIPFPIKATGTGGCSLSIELASPQGDAFWISGVGFTPNEELAYISRSGQEEISGSQKADAEGGFSVLSLPAVVGRESGAASYTARGSACQASVDYEWGSAAIRPQ